MNVGDEVWVRYLPAENGNSIWERGILLKEANRSCWIKLRDVEYGAYTDRVVPILEQDVI